MMAGRGLLLGLALTVACDDGAVEAGDDTTGGGAPTWRPLVSPSAWQLADPGDDPFAAERPADQTCDPTGVVVESLTDGPALEIDTGLCNWATVRQSALATAEAGDLLRLRIWHDELTAPEAPTSGSIFVVIGGETIVQTEVAIPSTPGLVFEEVELPVAIDLSAPIYAHVRNHGINTWSIAEISVLTN